MPPEPALLDRLATDAARTDREGVSRETLDGLAGLPGDDPAALLTAGRAMARACPATAWTATRFALAAAWLAGSPVAAGGHVGIVLAPGQIEADRDGDGWRISGHWQPAGGLALADRLLLAADIEGSRRLLLVPAGDATLERHAYLGGLRGAGWHRVVLDRVTVAADHVLPADDPPPALPHHLLGIALGGAEGGMADYVMMTRKRVSGIGGEAVAGFTQVQARLAETEADLAGIAHLFDGVVDRLRDDPADTAAIARDRAYIARKALDAVTRLVRQMGAMGIAETNPVQRRYRDLRAIAADPTLRWDDQLAARGRALLGIGAAA